MVNHHFLFLGMSSRLTIKLKHLTELTLALSGKNTNLGGVIDDKKKKKKKTVLTESHCTSTWFDKVLSHYNKYDFEIRHFSLKYFIKALKFQCIWKNKGLTCDRNIFCFIQCALPSPGLSIIKANQARHSRCHIHTLWTIKEVTMAAQGGQTLTSLLFCSWNHYMQFCRTFINLELWSTCWTSKDKSTIICTDYFLRRHTPYLLVTLDVLFYFLSLNHPLMKTHICTLLWERQGNLTSSALDLSGFRTSGSSEMWLLTPY